MLTFFRKIRKSLIDGSSARKYVLYAIGEIALVVIGILIALQINNWNEWRKDRIKAKEYSAALIESVVKDSLYIYQNVQRAPHENKRYASYVEFLKRGNITAEQLQDSIEGIQIVTPLFSPNTTVLEDLKSTGNLNLFNSAQRNAINDYYDLMLTYKEFQDDQTAAIDNESQELRKYEPAGVDIYKALNIEANPDYINKVLLHNHNRVVLQQTRIRIGEVLGRQILQQGRDLIDMLNEHYHL
jgi:hypothetical protein